MADKIATREAYGNALAALGEKYTDFVVLDADLAAATKTGTFKKAFPERFFNAGIAEATGLNIRITSACRTSSSKGSRKYQHIARITATP